MRITYVVVATILCSVVVASSNSDVLKKRLLYYLPTMRLEFAKQMYNGHQLINYGYLTSNCVKHDDSAIQYTDDRLTRAMGHVTVKQTLSYVYEVLIRPQGDYDNTLWYMSARFIEYRHLLYPRAGFHELIQSRDCEGGKPPCTRLMPAIPKSHHLSDTQCKRVLLFINEMKYRWYNQKVAFDYYFLYIYVLKHFNVGKEELVEKTDPVEKLFQTIWYLEDTLDSNKQFGETTIITVLEYRNQKLDLLQTELAAETDSSKKIIIEDELNFHKKVTNMIIQGWMIFYGISMNEKKVKLTDARSKNYEYDVQEINLES